MSNTMPNEKVQAFIVRFFLHVYMYVHVYVCIHVLVEKILKCKVWSINCPLLALCSLLLSFS